MVIGQAQEKLLWNFKGPLEATYEKQGLEVRAPARLLFLFRHSRLDHTQKASKFPKYVNFTVCPQDLPPALLLKLSPKESQIKSSSDNTVGGRKTASHKARGTNSSALPGAQPSQAGKLEEVQKPPASSLGRQSTNILQSHSLTHGATEDERSQSEQENVLQAALYLGVTPRSLSPISLPLQSSTCSPMLSPS